MPTNITTISDLERALKARNIRIKSAFFSYGTWKVSIGTDEGASYAGAHVSLQQALEDAVAHCDLKREMRHAVKP